MNGGSELVLGFRVCCSSSVTARFPPHTEGRRISVTVARPVVLQEKCLKFALGHPGPQAPGVLRGHGEMSGAPRALAGAAQFHKIRIIDFECQVLDGRCVQRPRHVGRAKVSGLR